MYSINSSRIIAIDEQHYFKQCIYFDNNRHIWVTLTLTMNSNQCDYFFCLYSYLSIETDWTNVIFFWIYNSHSVDSWVNWTIIVFLTFKQVWNTTAGFKIIFFKSQIIKQSIQMEKIFFAQNQPIVSTSKWNFVTNIM